ncbi:MAG: sodium/proline symporter PutP [Pseudomonadota bacterium]
MINAAYLSLGAYFVLMLAIGVYGYRTSTADVSEYMLGGRRLHPAVGALSAGASDMSGWMLMGLPGAIFVSGLSSAWIAIGLTVGAYLNYRLVAPRLRAYTELADDALTIPDFFAKRFSSGKQSLRVLASVVIVLFFTLYTSSGLVAGGKLFEAAFDLNYHAGLYLTAGVVVAYTLVGGFLAVSLTDFVQGCIMFVALILVPIVTMLELGGLSATVATVDSINPSLTYWLEGVSGLALLSSVSWGLGYFGQPHIIVRFMAIRSVADMPTARRIGMSWMLVTVIGAVSTGFAGLAYLQAQGQVLDEPETVFIVLSQMLFHPLIGGFLLAAILAAIMSTISSQLLVSSSSLTEDFYRTFVRRSASQKELVLIGRASVFGVAVAAIALAYDSTSSILSLVSNAWAGFGAAFGPVVLLSLFWSRYTHSGALWTMTVGAATVLLWIYVPIDAAGNTLSGYLYEIVPGFLLALGAGIVASLRDSHPAARVQDRHQQVEQALGVVSTPQIQELR